MAVNKNSGNVRKYRKPLNINVGLIIFGIIFIYILICVFLYFTSKHIVGYEVNAGTLSVTNVYKGIAIRTEEIVKCGDSGYVNYYAREGSKVAFGDLIYSIDESGKLSEMINSGGDLGENSLKDDDLLELKTEIVSFSNAYNQHDYNKVYDFKYNLKGTVLKLANVNALNSINTLSGNGLSGVVDFGRAAKSGILIYNVDGYENLAPEAITKESFQEDTYEKQQLISNELISAGDSAYKLALNENWSIVVPIDETRAAEWTKDPYVKVKFLKNQEESWATATVLNNKDGTYANLKFNNSMITFCTDRFVDIEIITNDEKGLKIPNSAIVEKEFFLIPTEYITKGGDGTKDGFMKESYAEDGSASTEFVATSIYNSTETDYYVDDSALRIGEYVVKPNSTEKYPISKKGSLIGVYNINKGYADFKQVIILYQNEEYAIVQSDTKYGLNVFDHIVLDSTTVKENDFIY